MLSRFLLTILSCLAMLYSFSVSSRDYAIAPVVTEISLNSPRLAKKLGFRLVLPRSYSSNQTKRYPLLISLAGESQFNSIVANTDWLSHVSFGPMPEVILLQFFQPDRNPDKAGTVLVDELLPFIRANYRTERLTMLEGFSTSGVTALEYFAKYPKDFQAAILPSVGLGLESAQWLDKIVTKLTTTLGQRYLFLGKSSMKDDHLPFTRMKASLQHFEHVRFEDLSALNYLSSSVIGFEMGMQALFSGREISDFKPFAEHGVDAILAYHQTLSERLGFHVEPTDNLMGLAGFYFEQNALQKGMAVYQHLIDQDQTNILLHIRFAQALLKISEQSLAKVWLKQAKTLAKQDKNEEALEFIDHLLSTTQE